MSKAPNPNIQETTLHLSVFYDTTKTDPDKIAKQLDAALQESLKHLPKLAQAMLGDLHVNHLHCPVVEVVEPTTEANDGILFDVDEIELDDGGCIERPDDDDGTMRRLDQHGNCEEVRRPADPNYAEWRRLFP